MRIGITDSGVGGLSVCAEVEARIRTSPIQEDVEVLYLNAAIEDDYSYNSMPDRKTKLQAFDRFLHSVRSRFQPDLLFIACNTLSMLFEDPYFDHHRHVRIEGIVDTGTEEMLAAFEREHDITFVVFATPTTIEEAVYGKRLRQHGVPASQVVEQACPGLPDAISNDGSGRLTANLLKKFVPAALQQLDHKPGNIRVFLGCTHYGYQINQFEQILQPLVAKLEILNPNDGAAEAILSGLKGQHGKGSFKISFITRYNIPDVVIESLSRYIGDKAPATLSALKNYTLLPALCGELVP